jgi:hypothetical protein
VVQRSLNNRRVCLFRRGIYGYLLFSSLGRSVSIGG